MLRNYIIIAWRNLIRHKVFSLINILGLAIGMAVCLLIAQYVQFERSYDQYHEHKDRIFRVQLDRYNNGELGTQWAAGCEAVGPEMKANFPEVEAFAKLYRYRSESILSYKDIQYREKRAFMTTESFFEVFSVDWLGGDKKNALSKPNTGVITESCARRYFGEENPIGKVLETNHGFDVEITGLIADFPTNSHMKLDLMISNATLVQLRGGNEEYNWQWDGHLTYLLLKPNTDLVALEKKLDALLLEQQGEYLAESNHRMDFSFQPLTDIHLYSHYLGEMEPNGDGNSVYFLSLIALFILIIAWINYINLSTARAVERAKEVGLRKATGASRTQIMIQFLWESLLLNTVAALISLTFFQLGRNWFATITDIPNDYVIWEEPIFWPAFIGMFCLGGLLSGFYPSWVLSSFDPVKVLKGKWTGSMQSNSRKQWTPSFRKGLVIVQLLASVLLITGTITVYQQLEYMQNHDLGVEIDQTLVIKGPGIFDSTLDVSMRNFQQELRKYPGITAVAGSGSIPGYIDYGNAGGIRRVGADPGESKQYQFIWADEFFDDLYGLEITAGRGFSDQVWKDTNTVVLNALAAQQMGFASAAEAIGQKIIFWSETPTIVGVVKDFHFKSMKEEPRPMIIRYWPTIVAYQSIRVNPQNMAQTIDVVRGNFETFFPGNPFDYFFLDEFFDQQYRSEEKFGEVFSWFALLAIVVASLGLFGLASFTLMNRTKEIGIRKVLGASISGIWLLLSQEYIVLIILANLIGLPISWWGINHWLESFPYQMEVGVELFFIPFLMIMLISLLTVSFQTIQTARKNPIESLRYE